MRLQKIMRGEEIPLLLEGWFKGIPTLFWAVPSTLMVKSEEQRQGAVGEQFYLLKPLNNSPIESQYSVVGRMSTSAYPSLSKGKKI